MATPPPPVRRTRLRGVALLHDAALNKGTAFSAAERRALGLEGLLPDQVETLEQQVRRVWEWFQALGSPLQQFVFVDGLRRTNLTLFHRFLEEHVEAVLPIVYTPTVGTVIQAFSRRYRSPMDGIFLSARHRGRLREVLAASLAGPVDLLLVTDSEGILGIGDQGIGGIHICHGKLAVYTLCAGLNPERVAAVALDVGTNRPALLEDPLYPGLRQPRLRGEAYLAFVDEFVEAVAALCPGACLQWEDFGTDTARTVLDRYREQLTSFNDDIQGTSGVASAAVLAACRGLGQRLADQRIVIFGAGTAGCGIADRLVRLLMAEGLNEAEALARIWAIDRQGLLLEGQAPMPPTAARFARPDAEPAGWGHSGPAPQLLEVVRRVKPTVLIGTSTVAGAFTEEVVAAMLAGVERPVILPLSNPTALAEATPADLLAWSGGRALVATGSPFAAVTLAGSERVIGQCNNCFLFPGLGFAAVAVGLSTINDGMIEAGLTALAAVIPASTDPALPLMPAIATVQAVSAAVAEAVALEGVRQGLAGRATTPAEAQARLAESRWRPRYGPVEAATP